MQPQDLFDRSREAPIPRFAPVVPIGIARILQNLGCLGDYHLLLAHDVLDKEDEYKEIYANKGYTIIMDNSLVELGYAMRIKDVIDAAKVVGAQHLVLPDTLKDASATWEQIKEALGQWVTIDPFIRDQFKLIPVVQGNSYSEHMELLQRINISKHIRDMPNVCIPRVIADTCGSRRHAIHAASQLGFRMHLLGFSENLIDDLACVRMPGVVGIDSAVPIRLALRGKSLSFDNPQDAGKRECYWDNPVGLLPEDDMREPSDINSDIADNLMHFRDVIGRGL